MKKILLLAITFATFTTTAFADRNVNLLFSYKDTSEIETSENNVSVRADVISYQNLDFGLIVDTIIQKHDTLKIDKNRVNFGVGQKNDNGFSWYAGVGPLTSDWNADATSSSEQKINGSSFRFGIAKEFDFESYKIKPEFNYMVDTYDYKNDFLGNSEISYKFGASIYGKVSPSIELGLGIYARKQNSKVYSYNKKDNTYIIYNSKWSGEINPSVKFSFANGIYVTSGLKYYRFKIADTYEDKKVTTKNYYLNLGYDF